MLRQTLAITMLALAALLSMVAGVVTRLPSRPLAWSVAAGPFFASLHVRGTVVRLFAARRLSGIESGDNSAASRDEGGAGWTFARSYAFPLNSISRLDPDVRFCTLAGRSTDSQLYDMVDGYGDPLPFAIQFRLFILPAWFVIVALTSVGLLLFASVRRRPAISLYRWCGYDPGGTPDWCPECGSPAAVPDR